MYTNKTAIFRCLVAHLNSLKSFLAVYMQMLCEKLGDLCIVCV